MQEVASQLCEKREHSSSVNNVVGSWRAHILTNHQRWGAPGLELETWDLAPAKLDAYIAPLGPERNPAALTLARELRRAGLSVEVGDGAFRLKKSFEAADRTARHIILLGEDELATNTVTVKTFATGEQIKLERETVSAYLKKI